MKNNILFNIFKNDIISIQIIGNIDTNTVIKVNDCLIYIKKLLKENMLINKKTFINYDAGFVLFINFLESCNENLLNFYDPDFNANLKNFAQN